MHEYRINFPKPFPKSVVCVDKKGGTQTRYVFEGGVLSAYVGHFDELTQAVVIWFHPHATNQVSRFYKIQNNTYTGLEYSFDKEGNITEVVDHGPPPAKRCSSISWNEYTQRINVGKLLGIETIFDLPEGIEFLESPEGKAFIKSPEGKAFQDSPEGKKFMNSPKGKKLIKKGLLD